MTSEVMIVEIGHIGKLNVQYRNYNPAVVNIMENATYLTPKLTRHIKNLVPTATVLDDNSKKLIISNIGQTIDRMLATNLIEDNVLEELEVILATLADIMQEEGPEEHLEIFASSPHFVGALFHIIDFWRHNLSYKHKYRLHTCYHMSVYLILALVDSAKSCLTFAQVCSYNNWSFSLLLIVI